MKTFSQFLVSATALGGFGGGTTLYILGRIMLPELHLPVPAYGAFFWFAFWSTMFVNLVYLVKLLAD